jgi:hypothetical protein
MHLDHPLASLALAGCTPRRARTGIAFTPVGGGGTGRHAPAGDSAARAIWQQNLTSALVGLTLLVGGVLASHAARAAAPDLSGAGYAARGSVAAPAHHHDASPRDRAAGRPT